MLSSTSNTLLRGGLHVDRQTLVAEIDGRVLDLGGRSFDLLAVLASEPGRVFSSKELFAAVWPGRRVEEGNLRVQIAKLRACLGNDAVKNIAGRGYLLTLNVAARPASPLPAPVKRLNNLPYWQDSLLGRNADGARLLGLLREHRLVCVLGAGGIGKTRLAHDVARQFAEQHSLSVCWVDLATIKSGPAVVEDISVSLARAAGLNGGPMEMGQLSLALTQAMAGQPGLVLFDNAEHVLQPLSAILEALLIQSSTLTFLVTSQQALRLKQEHAYWLDTLSLPDPSAPPEQILNSPAIQLLLRRADSHDNRFALIEQDLPYLARLVISLDGIALAIEMAAAVLPLVGSSELERHLTNRLLLLGEDVKGSHSRHRTLRAALDWSYALLTPKEQASLRQLSFFVAPFRLDTACSLLALQGQNEYEALRTLKSLADKSMLQLQPLSGPDQPRRLRMLETTRLYCQEAVARQASAAQGHEDRRRYIDGMAKLATKAREHFYAAGDMAWKDQWLPDHADWMQAFDLAYELRETASAAQIIDILVLGSNVTNNVRPALSRLAASRDLAETASPRDRAILLGWGGRVQSERLDWSNLRVDVCRQGDDERRLCVALAMQSCVLQECGNRERALQAYRECLALEQASWPARLRRRCSWIAARTLAVYEPTPEALEQALIKSRLLVDELSHQGATLEVSIVQTGMATVLQLQNKCAEALDLLNQCIDLQLACGARLEAGLAAGLRVALLAERLAVDTLGPGMRRAAADSAADALSGIAPVPAVLRAFDHSVAWLACQLGAADVAATALAASSRLRQELCHVDDAVQQRAKQSALLHVDLHLPVAERNAAQSRGNSMDAEGLRSYLLKWARQPNKGVETP